jgi:hypothetical protein
MTRNARRRLLNSNPSLKKGPLAHGGPDLLVWHKAGNHQGESGSCGVLASMISQEAHPIEPPEPSQNKGPLAHGSNGGPVTLTVVFAY